MLEDRFTRKQLILRIEICVNPEIWESDDIKREFSKHLEEIHKMQGIEIENLHKGDLTLFKYAEKLHDNLPRRVIIKKVNGSEVIDAAVITMEDDFDIVVDGPDKETAEHIWILYNEGIKIGGETYDDDRFLEGVIKFFRNFGSSYLLIVER